jgi:hypothetical protein
MQNDILPLGGAIAARRMIVTIFGHILLYFGRVERRTGRLVCRERPVESWEKRKHVKFGHASLSSFRSCRDRL